MSRLNRLVAVFILVFSFFTSFESVAQAQTIPNYTVSQGAVFKDGQEIKLLGVNWFGSELGSRYVPFGLESRDYKAVISQIKDLGFTAVRYPVCPATLTNQSVSGITFDNNLNQELRGLRSLEVMDALMAEFNRQGLSVVLDIHNLDCWTLGPLWYSDQYPATKWVSDLEFMAEHFAQYPNFIGIDLKNEPNGATWGTGLANDWKTAAETAGAAILAKNPNLLIFVEGIHNNPNCVTGTEHWYGGNFEPLRCTPIDHAKIPANKLVLSPHVYGPDVYWQSYFSASNFPNNLAGIWETHYGFLVDQGFAVIPGEWGGKFNVEGGHYQDLVTQTTLMEYWKQKKICNSFYWSFNPNSGDTGGILQGDWQTPWAHKVQALQHYYASCQTQVLTPSPTPSPSPSPNPSSIPTPSPTPNPTTQLKIMAAGTPANGQYPRLELEIDGAVVKTFAQVAGLAEAGNYQTLTYESPVSLLGKKIKLNFTNDFSTGSNNDRNLRVDKIVYLGQEIQIESPLVYSIGSWNSATNCEGKYAKSEWLHCNGYFEVTIPSNPQVSPTPSPTLLPSPVPSPSLAPSPTPTIVPSPKPTLSPSPIPTLVPSPTPTIQPSPTPVPSPSPSPTPSVVPSPVPSPSPTIQTKIKVLAAGIPSENVYPTLELRIKGQLVKTFTNIRGNPDQRLFQTLEYVANQAVLAKDVSIHFVNDGSSSSQDRNVLIDKIEVNNLSYETEAENTFSEGSWNVGTGCNSKYARSEWLHCNGYFAYDQTLPSGPSTLRIVTAGTPANSIYPTIQVKNGDEVIAEFKNIRGRPHDRVFETLETTHPTKLSINNLRFEFTNDGSSSNEDRNVLIDKVILDGVIYETESSTTYSEGSWNSGTGCSAKFAQSEWLHCAGYFRY